MAALPPTNESCECTLCCSHTDTHTHAALTLFNRLPLIDFFLFEPPGLFLFQATWRMIDPRQPDANFNLLVSLLLGVHHLKRLVSGWNQVVIMKNKQWF